MSSEESEPSLWDRPHAACAVLDPTDRPRAPMLPTDGRWGVLARRARTRRALMLVVASVLLPGCAQLLAGNKTVGRAALRVWALLLVGLPIGIWWSGRSGLVSLALHPQALATIQVSLVVLGLCWAALLVDAWRLGRPDRQSVGTRVLSTGMVLCLLAGVGTPVAYGVTLAGAQRDLVNTVFVSGGVGQLYKGRLNVAIMGGEPVRDGSASPKNSVVSYTDQNAVASVDLSTGQTTLISIPRNMQYAQFPPGTPMAKQFPSGFPDFFYGIYPYGAQHPAMFPGSSNPGATAVEQAMAQLLGIPIHYYVILNIQGFESLVDSLGGLTIRVTERLPIGGGHHAGACDLQGGGCEQLAHNKILGWINPGLQHMDGYTALWYARSREGTSDYDRMLRERCVLNGMLKEMDPLTVLTHFKSLVSSAKYAIKTDLTTGALSALVKVASKTKKSDVTSVLMNPPLIAAVAPDVAVARSSVQSAIAASAAPPTFAAASTKPGAKAAAKPRKKAAPRDPAHPADAVGGAPVPLSSVCSYS